MAKCEYEFSFKIKCDEPIHELKIKLVDKKNTKVAAATVPVVTESPVSSIDEESDIDDDIPPEMKMDF